MKLYAFSDAVHSLEAVSFNICASDKVKFVHVINVITDTDDTELE